MRGRFRKRIYACVAVMSTCLALVPLSYLTTHYWLNKPSRAEQHFHDSFAAGDLSAWNGLGMKQLCCAHSAVIEEAPDGGKRAVKFVLNRSDPDVKGNHRAELRLHSAEWGHAYDYTVSIFVPPEWRVDAVPVTVVQWHNVPDLWRGESALPGVLGIDIRGNEWVLEMNWGSGPTWLHHQRNIHTVTLWHGPLDRGRWTNWTFQIEWSPGEDGTIDAHKDGVLVAHHVGPNAYDDLLAPYLKIGLYVWWWKDFPERATVAERREIWFTNVQMAKIP